jgi:hypothetical protein
MILAKDKKQLYRLFALFLLFFAQGGLDFKSLLGLNVATSVMFLAIIWVYTFKYARYRIDEFLKVSLAIVLMWVMYLFHPGTLPIWIIFVVYSAYAVLLTYRRNPEDFVDDLSLLCKYSMYYTLAGIAAQYLLPSLMHPSSFYRYNHILYLFWYCKGVNEGFRFTGLAGEPGIWQLFLSLNLLFALRNRGVQVFDFKHISNSVAIFNNRILQYAFCNRILLYLHQQEDSVGSHHSIGRYGSTAFSDCLRRNKGKIV